MQVVTNAASSFSAPGGGLELENGEVEIVDSTALVRRKRAQAAKAWPTPVRVVSEPPPRPHLGAVRQFGRAVARSAAMNEVLNTLDRLAQTEVTVTLVGETG